jgi:DNA-binding response OmpR family regulator
MTQPLQLLLVEDCDDLALLMSRWLERAGHQVTSCATAEVARLALNHSRFDLILLDHVLPDGYGLELLRTLRHEGVTTPVILLTGSANEALINQALQAGVLDFVVQDPRLSFLIELPDRVRKAARAGAAG